MKIFKGTIGIVIAFVFLLGITACDGCDNKVQPSPSPTSAPTTVVQNPATAEPGVNDKDFVKVKSIKLNKSKVTVKVNKTFLLKTTYTPKNTTQRTLAFSTSDSKIAIIDATGRITGVKAGKATITVSVNTNKKVKATCVVTVTGKADANGKIPVSSISLNAKTLSLAAKSTYALKVIYNPATTTQKSVIFTSSNKSVATVDAAGKVTAVAQGSATITVASTVNAKLKASCAVTVRKAASTVYSQNGLSKTTKVNLKLAMFQGGVGTAWMSYAISKFHALFPNVTIKMDPSPSIDQKISTKINAGNNADMYDLFSTTRLTWEQYAEANKIVRVESLWNRTTYDSSRKLSSLVYPATYKYQVYKMLGHVYSMPYSLDIVGLFYDKNYFVKKGWNQAPKTYAQFTTLCDKIKASGIYPMTFYKGYLYGLIKPKEFELAAENGNTSFDYNFRHYKGKQYTSPEAIETYTNMYEMGKKGYFNPGSGTITNMISQMQLINHSSAMVVSGSWIQNEMKKSVSSSFKWGFMAMPFVSKSTEKLYVQQTPEDSLFIWAGKPTINKSWAKEFTLYLMNLNVQNEMTKAGLMSIRQDFDDSATRMANVQGVCKQILSMVSSKQIIPVNIGAHEAKLKDPNGYGDIAYNYVDDRRVQIALGKKTPLPILQQAETYFEMAQASGYE